MSVRVATARGDGCDRGPWPTALDPGPRADYVAAVFGSGPARNVLIIGAVFTGALYTLLLVASVLIPQSIDDVLTAYLARSGYWIHAGDLAPFEASAYNSVQTSYPVNGQLPTVRSSSRRKRPVRRARAMVRRNCVWRISGNPRE